MEKISKRLFKRFIKCQLYVLRKIFPAKRLDSRFLEYCFAEQEQSGKEYLSIFKRPKYSENVVSIEEKTEIQKKCAIVMQGPLAKKDDFTINTVRIYKKLYPGIIVIVSTWEGENPEYIRQLNNESNCRVICSKAPEHSGLLNLNYQITSTMAGLREAKNLGREYVFKSRTDNRISTKGVFEFLYSILDSYPVDKAIAYQKYRIVAGAEPRYGSMFSPFWFSDQFGFGYIEDMLKYWDYLQLNDDFSVKDLQKTVFEKGITINERTNADLAAETRIVRNYFLRMENRIPECSVKEYWEIIKKQFIIVSHTDVGLFWPKYDYMRFDEAWWQGSYYFEDDDSKCVSYNWDFLHWLLLYNGVMEYQKKYELPANTTRYHR